MEDEVNKESVDPTTQVSSPDNPSPAPEAAPDPNMSVGQGQVDPKFDAQQKKVEDFCGAATDPKLDPQNSTFGRGASAVQDFAINRLPAALQSIAPRISDGPTGYGFGDDAKQKCIDRENASPGERLKMDMSQIKERYDAAKKN